MTIRRYNRVMLPGDPFIYFHRNLCYCSGHECGATIKKSRTTGYSIYLWKFIFYIGFDKPKNCNSPF